MGLWIAHADGDGLGKQIEKGYADDGSGAEAQDQMQFVAQLEGQQTTGQGTEECGGGDEGQ